MASEDTLCSSLIYHTPGPITDLQPTLGANALWSGLGREGYRSGPTDMPILRDSCWEVGWPTVGVFIFLNCCQKWGPFIFWWLCAQGDIRIGWAGVSASIKKEMTCLNDFIEDLLGPYLLYCCHHLLVSRMEGAWVVYPVISTLEKCLAITFPLETGGRGLAENVHTLMSLSSINQLSGTHIERRLIHFFGGGESSLLYSYNEKNTCNFRTFRR